MLVRRWFSQDREDKRLYSALGHIKNGRYVDIGAYEPEFNSVTKVFYDDGWSGINIEPNPRAFKMLEAQRPRDTNIRAVVTDRGIELADLYLTSIRGWSSLRQDVAIAARERGMQVEKIVVEAMTLDDVFRRVEGDTHFLKVDVEGAEDEVFRSGDLRANRPWVILAESNFPQSNRCVYHHDKWEPMLLDQGYVFKLNDGLNRWYVAEERLDNVGEFVV